MNSPCSRVPCAAGIQATPRSINGADDDRVGERAEAGALAQRHPRREQRERADDRDLPDREVDVAGDPLVEDVPRVQAGVRLQQQGHGEPEQHEAGEQADRALDGAVVATGHDGPHANAP